MYQAFTCLFNGVQPIGACAVVTARSKMQAKKMLESELEKLGLKQEIPIDEVKPIDLSRTSVDILLNK